MPTIIESLLFEIGIDTKKLGGDAKEADNHLKGVEDRSHKAVQELEERGKQSGAMFRDLKEQAGGFFSMIAGAYSAQKIAGMSKDIMLNAESLGLMSSNLGMATERLKTWQLAAEKNGGSAGSMNGLLNQAAMVAAATKRGEDFAGSQEFFGLGGKREDLQSPEAYMMAVSRIIKAQYAQGEQTGLYSANALSVPPDLVYLLKQGPDAIRSILQEQSKYANVSEAWAKSSHETMNNFRNIGDSMTKIGTLVLESINPELRKMAEYSERSAQAALQQKDAIKATAKENIDQVPNEARGAAWGRIAAMAAGRLGAPLWLGSVGGPVGAVFSDLLNPKALATDEQERNEWLKLKDGDLDDKGKKAFLDQLERENNLPGGAMDAVWAQESGRGKNKGPSSAGAMGDFQLMKKTWEAYKRPEDDNIMDFRQNAAASARFLGHLYNEQFHGDLDAALRWYNAGGNYQGRQAGAYSEQVRDRMPANGATSGRTDIQVNGPITIQTQSTDAAGIKKEFADSMGSYSNIASMAETGSH